MLLLPVKVSSNLHNDCDAPTFSIIHEYRYISLAVYGQGEDMARFLTSQEEGIARFWMNLGRREHDIQDKVSNNEISLYVVYKYKLVHLPCRMEIHHSMS